MKRILLLMTVGMVALGGFAGSVPFYSLGTPRTAILRNTTEPDDWAVSNACYAPVCAAHFSGTLPPGGESAAGSAEAALDAPVRTIASAQVGFPFERNKPQYYLGDALMPPGGVDWDLTYAAFVSDPAQSERFLFDTGNRSVYVICGDTTTFAWVVRDESGAILTNQVPLVVSPVSSVRPKNIFWTDDRYGGRTIDLTGKFARLYGSSNLTTKVIGQEETGTIIDGKMTYMNKVVSGLYIDTSGGGTRLYAAGKLEGQAVLVYYDSASYERIVGVQVVEVTRPRTEVSYGTVGETLKPTGRGYSGIGLVASPTSLSEPDDYGPYLYQHRGKAAYSPKHKEVFALRPTDDKTRNHTQIYWMEVDDQGVEWPFEIDEYRVSWPENPPVFVRSGDAANPGKGIVIPMSLSAELQKYQEGADGHFGHHANDPVDGVFSSFGPGLSLLKLTGDDNVWFLPVKSVLRTDTSWFTLEPATAKVGESLSLRGGSVSGLAEGRSIAADRSVPGYLYEPVSDPIWNASLYSPDGIGWQGCPSVVCAATASTDTSAPSTVEVWWSTVFREEGMADGIRIPALPQVYSISWPKADEMPQIALSSQKGSAGQSRYCVGQAIVFDDEQAHLPLPSRTYFGSAGGTVALWTKPYDARAEFADSQLLTLGGDTNGNAAVSVRLVNDDGQMKAVARIADGEELACKITDPKGWTHVTLGWSDNSAVLTVMSADGQSSSADATAPSAATLMALSDSLAGNAIGFSAETEACAAPMRMVDEVCFWNRRLGADEATAAAYARHDGTERGMTLCVTVANEFELRSDLGAETRRVSDLVSGRALTAYFCLREAPGAPVVGGAVIDSDVTPAVYRQTDPKAVGFNPNEEHAFVRAGSGGYVVWALRCDLNALDTASPPVTLVQYVQDGVAKMALFGVVATNGFYGTFGDTCTAGLPLPGPQPLTMFDDPWRPETYWEGGTTKPYRDRKGQLWARAAGDFDIFMYYAQRSDFDWPAGFEAPQTGESVPWLAYLKDDACAGDGLKPHPWRWDVAWPESVPEMRIGQTLTVAEGGLPEMWNAKAMAVIYPTGEAADRTVLLTDPTCARHVALGCRVADLAKIGISGGPGGKLISSLGLFFFAGVSPALAHCLYLDPSNDTLVMRGHRESNPGGVELIFPNVLSEADAADVLTLADESGDGTVFGLFRSALKNLSELDPEKPTAVVEKNGVVTAEYRAVDHYALTAMGATNYVVMIENDATNDFCDAGNPINMHIFRTVPKYYVGRVVTREDPLNLLSQVLGVHCTETFAGRADDYVFDWRRAEPRADGAVPADFDNEYKSKFSEEDGRGRTSFTIGGQGDTLDNMVNAYWTCRYKAHEGTAAHAVMGDAWSDWYAPPALAEGWVQRVLNNVTPFNQRMTDLYENEVEPGVTMLQQAGRPYTGDVALNQENLTSVGLIELYRTILNKAESMSLMLGKNNRDANQQLLLAVERLADLYGLLGAEAYSDAMNPTIGFGTELGEGEASRWIEVGFGAASSSLFCFDNQVPTLLDEELALLRGRACVNAPDNTVGPYYNRLIWNFTRGITAGEVAYAVNYNISARKSSTITAATAAELYPQGHGDAYGHYLSALQGWYRLLRNPNFSWGEPSMDAMNVADNAVNVDYHDEAKFAETAASVARTARRTVELTALKHWRDRGADTVGGGYLDADSDTAFGYGEWASRGTFGALCNWAVANSLLPAAETNGASAATYEDEGLMLINRGTVATLGEIATAATAIQQTVDRMDAGRNPLGLDADAIPFDLTPIGDEKDLTHYEQIRERAANAFANARTVLDHAQEYGNQIRIIDEARSGVVDSMDLRESYYSVELMKIYGRPYADDIGPGKTYPEGYYGPDLYHFMWMNDLSAFGLTDIADTMVVTTCFCKADVTFREGKIEAFDANKMTLFDSRVIAYSLSANGLVVKDGAISGERPASGEIQQAYADFLGAYARVKVDMAGLEGSRWKLGVRQQMFAERMNALDVHSKELQAIRLKSRDYVKKLADEKKSLVAFKLAADLVSKEYDFFVKDIMGQVGLATTLFQDGVKVAAGVTAGIAYGALAGICAGLEGDIANCDEQIALLSFDESDKELDYSYETDLLDLWNSVLDARSEYNADVIALQKSWGELEQAQVRISAIIQRGEMLLQDRELERFQFANNFTKLRYNDMLFRTLRNDALAKYDAAFDLAKTHAFLAAKAYGYETGSPVDDDFLRGILAAQALGEADADKRPVLGGYGDAGLAGALATMDANWANRKTQLGINNPQSYATWFSLRHGNFRILSDARGDAAWKTELAKYWVDDIRANADFVRHCQPFASQFGLAQKEPGLIIPFETTIDFACNLFGKPLAFNDAQFDSSYYATKIAAAGVWFEGYNERTGGGAGAFSTTPNVYLVPVGTDRMRVPGSDGEEIVSFNVVDQTIPAPYPITAAELAETFWLPSYADGEFAGVDALTRIRRHPSFRAAYGNAGVSPDDSALCAKRLVGRSVWNTRWILVIPAGTLNSDREAALKTFIYGLDTNRDGVIDVQPVCDIKIGFKTYSVGGK